jgi:hypothetical protein
MRRIGEQRMPVVRDMNAFGNEQAPQRKDALDDVGAWLRGGVHGDRRGCDALNAARHGRQSANRAGARAARKSICGDPYLRS